MRRTGKPWFRRAALSILAVLMAMPAAAAPAEGSGRRRLVARLGSAEVQWIRARAIALDSTDPSAEHGDLLPLLPWLQGAEVIALGEGTHFTREFQTVHHRLIRFLAEELGFRTFTFEASWPDFHEIDDYIRTGEGDPAALLTDDNYRFWDTEEMLELVRWARSWNESHPESDWVSLAGVDPAIPERYRDHVTRYLDEVDAAAGASAASAYACLTQGYSSQSDAFRAACRAALQAVHDGMVSKRAAYEAAGGAREYAAAVRSALMTLQAEHIMAASGGERYYRRDESMAENVLALKMGSPRGLITYRGHNAHVSADGYVLEQTQRESTGTFLRRELGTKLFAIGSTSSRGTYHAYVVERQISLHVVPFPVPEAGSWETLFEGAGYPAMLVPFREPLPEWTRALRRFFSFVTTGVEKDPLTYAPPLDLPAMFDAMIYVRETTPTRLLR